MPTAARRVRRLRLRGESEEALRRAALVLEDAMRTASLHDEGGRILLVRRLALGRLRAGARPEQVARTVEGALEAAAARCRHGTEPTAGQADMVWFADALEAHLALARRLLGGPPPHEWYWRLVARSWRPDDGVKVGLAALARSLAALPEAGVALPAWAGALTEEGYEGALAEALDGSDLEITIRAGVPRAWRPVVPGETTPTREGPGAATSRGRTKEAHHAHPTPRRTAVSDADNRRLTPARRVDEPDDPTPASDATPTPGEVEGPSPPTDAFALPPTTLEAQTLRPTWPEPTAPRPGLSSGPEPVAASPDGSRTPVDLRTARPSAYVTPHDREVPPPSCAAPPPRPAARSTPPVWPGLSATQAGGVPFLLNVLVRLGHLAWLDDHPAWAEREVARRVLGRVLDTLDVPREDPVRVLVRPTVQGPARAREAVVVRAWSVAMHGWLRRYVGIGMAELVLRPGRLAASRTHVDVWFDPELCDLRIRRAGLDLDPGWLPWLERVVAFHYQPRGGR